MITRYPLIEDFICAPVTSLSGDTSLTPVRKGNTAPETRGSGSLTVPVEIQFPCFSLGVKTMGTVCGSIS